MQQTSFQVASKTNQSDFKRLLRIVAFLCVLAGLVGISALDTEISGGAQDETAGPPSSAGAAFAISHSSEFSNGMPLP